MRRLLALLLSAALASPAGAAAPRVSTPPRLGGTAVTPVTLPAAPLMTLAAPALAPQPALDALPSALPAPAALIVPAAAPVTVKPAGGATLTLVVPGRARDGAPAPAVAALEQGAALAAETPSDVGRLYDAAPAAPDFAALTPVNEPAAPRAWRPGWTLLKPAAALYNAARRAAYERRVANPRPGERVTIEEHGLRESLVTIHDALAQRAPQAALAVLTERFETGSAKSWFRANDGFSRYRDQAMAYYRFTERAVLAAYGRSHARASDAALVAEARAAERDGSLAGRAYRATALQDKDKGHCAHHALFNAIAASVGFVYPVRVHQLVESAKRLLNVSPVFNRTAAAERAQLEAQLGVKFGKDVDEGMGDQDMARYASLLGMRLSARAPPADEAGWLALLRGPQQPLLTYRMFHPRFRHDETGRRVEGHDYRVLHHATYLLGAFPSRSRGVTLFMVQDSGSGITAFLTAEELTALVMNVQLLDARVPARLPRAAAQ